MHGGEKHIHSIGRPRHSEDSWRYYSILDSGQLDCAIISIYLMDGRGSVGERSTGGGFSREGRVWQGRIVRGTRTYTKVLISVTAAERPSQYICMPRQERFGAGQECTQLGAKSDDDQRIWNGMESTYTS